MNKICRINANDAIAKHEKRAKRNQIKTIPYYSTVQLETSDLFESFVNLAKGPNINTDTFDKLWSMKPKESQFVWMFGKHVETRRKTRSYMHDYTFSGQVNKAEPLPIELKPLYQWALRRKSTLNGCLVNWYEEGDSIGPHQDKSAMLLDETIYSFSLGSSATFKITPTHGQPQVNYVANLHNGDVIVMHGDTNKTHKHQVLPLKSGKRINVTFRSFK